MTSPLVLVCDDDRLVRDTVSAHLEGAGFSCVEAGDGVEGLEVIRERAPACIVLDLKMPRKDGLEVLQTLRETGNQVPVVVVTSTGGIDEAIRAIKLGAEAYLEKPVDLREVSLAVERALEHDRLTRQVTALEGTARRGRGEFIGRAPALRPLFDDLDRLRKVAAPMVLLLGESGTGKDVLARTIHAQGPRKNKVFVEVDCAALPETLLESELFGHERGAFTDARSMKRGLFEVAHGGTVFLDEIGELAPGSQAKLLRALENRTFKRVGGVAPIELDACVIAATNRDLKREVEAGRFRADLFYRLDLIALNVPPLRERAEDIPLLCEIFLSQFNKKLGTEIEGIAPAAVDRMLTYRWPGNVRELKNVLERVAILHPRGQIELDDLPTQIRYATAESRTPEGSGHRFTLPPEGIVLDEVERSFLIQALERTDGNRTDAGRLLGLTRHQVRTRIQRYGLDQH